MKHSWKSRLSLLLCLLTIASTALIACQDPFADGEESKIDSESAIETESETESEQETESEFQTEDPFMQLVDFTYIESSDGFAITGVKDPTKTTYTIPDCVVSIEAEAFKDCTALTSLTIPDSVTLIAPTAFDGCDALIEKKNGVSYVDRWIIGADKTIESVEWKEGTVGIVSSAFEGCAALKELSIPDTVEHIGFYAFDGCTAIEVAAIPSTLITGFPKTSLREVTITKGLSVDNHGFYNCKTLVSVTFPDELTKIGEYSFAGCSALSNMTLPQGLTTIGLNAFQNCTSLESLVIPEGVTGLPAESFAGCKGLTSITIADSVMNVGTGAFANCSNLIQKEDGVSYVDRWVIDCNRNKETVTLRENTVGIADSAFQYCRLTEITLPAGVKVIGHYAFSECGNLGKAVLPEGLLEIGFRAFYACNSLREINIPSTMISLDPASFELCVWQTTSNRYGITYVDGWVTTCLSTREWVILENKTVVIGKGAFGGCANLSKIYFQGTKEEWEQIRVLSNNHALENVTVYFYSETEQTDGNWWHFDDLKINPIEW